MGRHELTISAFPGPLTDTSWLFGAGTGSNDQTPDTIAATLVYDYIKTKTDQLYPTQQQLSSVSDVANGALNQADSIWRGRGLGTTEFAPATSLTGLVTYQQLQDSVLSTTFDIPALDPIADIDQDLDKLLIYDASEDGYRNVSPNVFSDLLLPLTDRGDILVRSATGNVRFALGAAALALISNGTDLAYGQIETAGITDKNVTYEKIQDVSATSRVLGRISPDAGTVEELTGANLRTIIGVGSSVQAWDADLDAIAAFASTGFAARTASDTWAQRSLTAPAAGLTIGNPAGIAGDPTFALANDLAALEALGSTGFAVRSAADTWVQRSFANAAAGITWTNADGVSGNPTPVLANDLAALEGLGSTGFAVRTASDTWAQRSLAQPAAGLTISNSDGVSGNPTFALANDLLALEGLSGTNTIPYRSGVDTWGGVTIGGLLSFTGGTLNIGDAELTALAGLTSASNRIPRFTGSGTADLLTLDTDGTLAANSDTTIATQKAVKTYVDQIIAAQDAMVFKGVIDCSANPNYPAADRGATYRVSVAGKIGGASGVNVEVGDMLICLTDSTASGNQATVGTAWSITQTNLDGAVIGPASATDSHFAQFDGTTGKLIKGGLSLDTDGTLSANSATRVPSQSAVKTYAQPIDATLTALAAVSTGADKLIYATGSDTFTTTDFTSVARTLVNQTTQAAMRTTGLGMSANGSSLVSAADYAAMKVLLGLTVGTDVQAYDADLTTLGDPAATELTLGDDEADFLYIRDTSASNVFKRIKSKNLGYTPSGTGAALRTLQSKLRETGITPTDFAAVGDGSTNDWTNYGNAQTEAAAQNAAVYLPSGKTFELSTNEPTRAVNGPGRVKVNGYTLGELEPRLFPARASIYLNSTIYGDQSFLYSTFPTNGGQGNTIIGAGAFQGGVNAAGESSVNVRNTVLGALALTTPVEVERTEAIGQGALRWCRYGQRNSAIGSLSMQWGGGKLDNDPAGQFYQHDLLYNAGTPTSNVAWDAFGLETLLPGTRAAINSWLAGTPYATTGTDFIYNVSQGRDALTEIVQGERNTAMGYRALSLLLDGDNNSAFGDNALFSSVFVSNNTAVGRAAAFNHVSGDGNVYVGRNAGFKNTSGANNVYIGQNAGNGSSGTNSGSGNVIIGNSSGVKADGTSADFSNKLRIQNSATQLLVNGDFSTGFFGVNVPEATSLKSNLHVYVGDSGVGVPTATNAGAVVESSTHAAFAVYTPASSIGGIYFGDPGNETQGGVTYNHSTDQMRLRVTGGNRVIVDQDFINMAANTAGNAALQMNGTKVVGTRKTGWTAATGTATRTSFATGSVTLPNLAQAVKALIDDLISHGLIGT